MAGTIDRPARRTAGPSGDDAVALYVRDVTRVPLLTADEEVALAKRMEHGAAALAKLAGDDPLSADERRALGAAVRDGEAAREHLVLANTRLVMSVAKRYANQGVPFLDLVQEGNLGLMTAVGKFDWRRGHKFSTYATWWVRQAISRALADQGRTIRLPVHMRDRIRRLYGASRRLEQTLGREPTVGELAEQLDLSPAKVKDALEVARRPMSLEQPMGDGQDTTLGELIEAEDEPPPVDHLSRLLLRADLERTLQCLSQREARVLELRFGLTDGRAYTLKEIGEKFGLTRERIRQIEKEALERLRHPKRTARLADYLR